MANKYKYLFTERTEITSSLGDGEHSVAAEYTGTLIVCVSSYNGVSMKLLRSFWLDVVPALPNVRGDGCRELRAHCPGNQQAAEGLVV